MTEAISLYVRTRRSEGYSPATLRQFAYQLNRFGTHVGARCALWLRRYLKTRRDNDPALFATAPPAHRMSTWHMRSIIKAVAGRCGLAKKVSPHVMRHTLSATTLLTKGLTWLPSNQFLVTISPKRHSGTHT